MGMNDRAARAQRLFEWPIVVSALLVIPAIVIEQSTLGEPWDSIALAINWMTWLVFLAELIVMLVLVPNRWHWLRKHPLELPLVVLTPPILPPGLQALRALRLLRVLRLERVARFARQATSVDALRYAGLIALLAALGGGAAFETLERQQHPKPGFFDGIWWSVSTMTTVGYGDIVPTTTAGRILAMALMLIGIAFVAILTGAIAQRFLSPEVQEIERELEIVGTEDEEIATAIYEIRSRLDRLEALVQRTH
jgi:voltage-gated potassium channel